MPNIIFSEAARIAGEAVLRLQELSPHIAKVTPQLNRMVSKIGLAQIAQIALLYQLYDSALANILGLETLRHGTTLYSYAKIHLQGAKTHHGGSSSLTKFADHTRSKIFVYPDYSDFFGKIYTRIGTCIYSSLAYRKIVTFTESNKILYTLFYASIPFGIFTPTVKFRFTREQLIQDFKGDTRDEAAIYTEKNIGITHLGITGSLIQGLNPSVFKRIYDNPSKFLWGCAQLVAAVALTCIYCGIVTTSPLVNTAIVVLTELMQQHKVISTIALGILHLTAW